MSLYFDGPKFVCPRAGGGWPITYINFNRNETVIYHLETHSTHSIETGVGITISLRLLIEIEFVSSCLQPYIPNMFPSRHDLVAILYSHALVACF